MPKEWVCRACEGTFTTTGTLPVRFCPFGATEDCPRIDKVPFKTEVPEDGGR